MGINLFAIHKLNSKCSGGVQLLEKTNHEYNASEQELLKFLTLMQLFSSGVRELLENRDWNNSYNYVNNVKTPFIN